MAHLTLDSHLETDNCCDWSLIKSRVDSFRDSVVAEQVSAAMLAQAGFYFIGPADRVRCFSCKMTVENWCRGDRPVERHKEVSPSCKFLSCTHRPGSNGLFSNASPYSEEAEDMQFRLRTGEVVDETTYPKVPHMCSEDARLRTFQPWPSSAPVSPHSLAQAGLFYLGESDRVQCFCCGGMLGGWEAGDTAWGEHSKHFANCFFILGHDVGNVPFQGDAEEVELEELVGGGSRTPASPSVPMGSFQERLESYAEIQHPIDCEMLARAGFYSGGVGDRVICFQCGGGIKNWQPDEDPWIEHAKHYPGCRFLLTEKGQDFVNQVQLQEPRRNRAASSQNGFSRQQNEEDPIDILLRLQREKQCKICMDRDFCMVFIPCGHLVCCSECSQSLSKCPICCGSITQKIKTYIS
ncbi:unnamed protein product [Lota lota]